MIKRQDISPTKKDFKAELKEGMSWLWHHPFLRSLAIILGSINAISALSFSVFILFAQEDLHTSVFTFGVLSTGGAIGGALGGFTSSRVIKRFGRARLIRSIIYLSPVFLVINGASSHWQIVWVVTVIEMFFVIMWNVITVSMRQEIIPDQILGRVNSVYRFFGLGSQPIGAILGGFIVAISLRFISRSLALRLPLFVAAGLSVILAFFALPHLTQAKIDEARGKSDDL